MPRNLLAVSLILSVGLAQNAGRLAAAPGRCPAVGQCAGSLPADAAGPGRRGSADRRHLRLAGRRRRQGVRRRRLGRRVRDRRRDARRCSGSSPRAAARATATTSPRRRSSASTCTSARRPATTTCSIARRASVVREIDCREPIFSAPAVGDGPRLLRHARCAGLRGRARRRRSSGRGTS